MIQYNTNLTDELLFEIVHFAYHKEFKFERTCSSNLRSVIEFASNFNVIDLIQYCFTYFMKHCSPELVLKTYELATKPQFHNRQAKLFFQRYIEDNIKFVSKNIDNKNIFTFNFCHNFQIDLEHKQNRFFKS